MFPHKIADALGSYQIQILNRKIKKTDNKITIYLIKLKKILEVCVLFTICANKKVLKKKSEIIIENLFNEYRTMYGCL